MPTELVVRIFEVETRRQIASWNANFFASLAPGASAFVLGSTDLVGYVCGKIVDRLVARPVKSIFVQDVESLSFFEDKDAVQ